MKYATREVVARALDAMETAYAWDQIDRALESESRLIEKHCNRRFYPEVVTLRFDWPDRDLRGDGYTLSLGEYELVSLATLTNGDGQVIAGTDYFLQPANSGPPYSSVAIDLGSSAAFEPASGTWQQALTLAGVRGFDLTSRPAGALAGAVASTSATTIDVTDGHAIGVWDLLTIGTERLEVTGRQLVDTTEDLAGAVDAETSTTTIPVTDGTAFTAGEEITVDSETMLITRITGNNLIVRRAVGSVLAGHTSGAAIYAPRRLTVTRGALGTTAATHLDAATITAQVYPEPVVTAVVAGSIVQVLNEQAGYAGTHATGDAAREASVGRVDAAREAAKAAYGRRGLGFC